MRKIKPKEKREIKINEKKEIEITRQPTKEELDFIEFGTSVFLLTIVCERHKKIWDKEVKENDGIVPFHKYMLICQALATANKIFDEDIETIGEKNGEENFFVLNAMQKQIGKCITAVGEEGADLTADDLIQRLPRGFMATLGSWARMIKNLDTAKMKSVSKDLCIENKIKRLINLSNQYMKYIYDDIAFIN